MNVVSTSDAGRQVSGHLTGRLSDAEWSSIIAAGRPLPELYQLPPESFAAATPRRLEPRSGKGWRRSLHAALWDSQRSRARAEIVAAYTAGAAAVESGSAPWSYRPRKGDAESLRSWAVALDGCSRRWLVAWPTGRPDAARPIPNRCMDRLCPACAEVRAARVVRYLEARAAELPGDGRLRFLTLTQKKRPDEGPREARRRLRASVARLRRSAGWAAHVEGALVKYEETHADGEGDTSPGWHAHAHLVLAGSFWPQAELAQAWADACGDGESRIADIRAVNGSAGLREIAKYTAKAAALPPLVVAEYRLAMAGQRDLACLGAWYHVPINGYDDAGMDDPADEAPQRDAWAPGAAVTTRTLERVEWGCRVGDPEALQARAALLAWLERTRERRDRRVERSRRRRRRETH